MPGRVLVPVDGSVQSDRACELAFEEFPEATLVLLHVINPVEAGYSTRAAIPPAASEEWYEQQKELANEQFDEIEAKAAEYGIEVERTIEVGKTTRIIVEFTEKEDIDHIVMGSHGREGVSRILLGSVAETIVRRSPVPVTVAR
ncbi:MAG: universal stress protein [Haloarculaceae archaeon]